MDVQHEILKNVHIAQSYFKITIKMPAGSPLPSPGQFYQIRCSTSTDPLFRRPFSVHQVLRRGSSTSLEILYRVAGRGTDWLSQREKGEKLDILGPLGNGFIIEDGSDPIVLVSRGIGIAPLYAMGVEVRRKDKKRKIFFLIGARLKERIFYASECKELGKVFIYTDDGSMGFRGRAPDLLAHLLQERKIPQDISLYACGPAEMLKELASLSTEFGFRGQVALEDRMGCGFGACLACACPLDPKRIVKNNQWKKPGLHWSPDGNQVYALICKDGPVFDLNEVDWNEWTA